MNDRTIDTNQHPTSVSVTAHVEAQVTTVSDLVFSVAVATTPTGPAVTDETLTVTVDGQQMVLEEIEAPFGGRLHLANGIPAGQLVMDYAATTSGSAPGGIVTAYEAVQFCRPSRYAESDKLAIIGSKRFQGLAGQELIDRIVDWVHENLFYVPGSSGPTDGAVDTYLAQEGVCRDFAHLTIAMLRACGIPARLVAVYAPGLTPMDFHAVVEAALDGRWQVVDATRLAPRASLVRIATGADAGETSVLPTQSGGLVLGDLTVTAVADGGLPTEDPQAVVYL